MEHNAEPEAVDLLLEVDDMAQLLQHVNEGNYARTCLYLTSAAAYLAEPDDSAVLHVAFDAYMKVRIRFPLFVFVFLMNFGFFLNMGNRHSSGCCSQFIVTVDTSFHLIAYQQLPVGKGGDRITCIETPWLTRCTVLDALKSRKVLTCCTVVDALHCG